MKTVEYTIKDALGIHARPAGLLVKEAGKFASKIMIASPKKEVDAKRIMGVMSPVSYTHLDVYKRQVIEDDVHVFVGQSKEGDILNLCGWTIAGIRVIYRLFHVFEEHERCV